MLNAHLADSHANDNLSKLRACLLRTISSKHTVQQDVLQFDARVPGTNNHVRKYWKGIAAPILDEHGNVTFLLYTPIDVTESYACLEREKGQEQGFKVKKELYKSIFA